MNGLAAVLVHVLAAALRLQRNVLRPQAFECEEFDNGKSYLRADYTVECLSSEHTPIVVLGVIALILYPVGVPCAFL